MQQLKHLLLRYTVGMFALLYVSSVKLVQAPAKSPLFSLRVIKRDVPSNGQVSFDDVRFIPPAHPIVRITALRVDDTMSVQQDQIDQIQANVTLAPGTTGTSVTCHAPKQASAVTFGSTNHVSTPSQGASYACFIFLVLGGKT